MTKTGPTPGPWQIRREQTPGQFVTIEKVRDADNSVICTLHVNAEANGRLIAAAPDLLAVCKDALEVEIEAGFPDSELASRLRAAIAKAKGT